MVSRPELRGNGSCRNDPEAEAEAEEKWKSPKEKEKEEGEPVLSSPPGSPLGGNGRRKVGSQELTEGHRRLGFGLVWGLGSSLVVRG